jgi:pimeloyl-ACP methyl ester carboxylesterase
MTAQFIPVHGGQLYCETAGDPANPAIILIHAGVANLRMWQPQMAHYADRYFVVAYDTRGYGRTTSSNTEFSNREDLHALVHHLEIDRAIVIGNSRGGQIATDFTLEYPNHVRALVLVGSGLGGVKDDEVDATDEEKALFGQLEALYEAKDWDGMDALELHLFYDGLKRAPEQVDAAFREAGRAMMLENRAHNDEQITPQPLDPPAAGRLSAITIPTLIVIGEFDETPTHGMAQILERGIVGSRRIVMQNTAHIPSLEHPAQFNAHVDAFLAGL